MDLALEVSERGTYAVLSVRGEIDVFTAPKFHEALIGLVTDGKRQIVVDLGGVDLLDTTGLGVLIGGLKRVRSHDGELVLVGPRARVMKVLETTRLTRVFSIFDSVDAAVAAGATTVHATADAVVGAP